MGLVILLSGLRFMYILTVCNGSDMIDKLILSHNMDNTRKRCSGPHISTTRSKLSLVRADTGLRELRRPVRSPKRR